MDFKYKKPSRPNPKPQLKKESPYADWNDQINQMSEKAENLENVLTKLIATEKLIDYLNKCIEEEYQANWALDLDPTDDEADDTHSIIYNLTDLNRILGKENTTELFQTLTQELFKKANEHRAALFFELENNLGKNEGMMS